MRLCYDHLWAEISGGEGHQSRDKAYYSCPRSSKSGRVPTCGFHNSVTFMLFPAFAAAAACCASRSSARRLRPSSSPTVWWSRWPTTSACVGYTATTTTSGRVSFSGRGSCSREGSCREDVRCVESRRGHRESGRWEVSECRL
jgi:hypothetical protein